LKKICFLRSEHQTNDSELRDDVKHGGMAEWFKAAVLKTASLKGDVGSNPTPSARLRQGSVWQAICLADGAPQMHNRPLKLRMASHAPEKMI
jgi:hypothetical protein